MKWHMTEEEQQIIQRHDENNFQNRMNDLGYRCCKISENFARKSPDFEIDKDGQKIIIELKSRFNNEEYNRIATEFTDRIATIRFGYYYTFRHYFDKMPSVQEIKTKITIINSEIASLHPTLQLPYALRLGDYQMQKVCENIISMNPRLEALEAKNLHRYYASNGDHTMAIELTERNDLGHLRCALLVGRPPENVLKSMKHYFDDTLMDAKRQLSKYIGCMPVGVFYYNHTPFAWDNNDNISLYGDLMVAFSTNPNNHEAQIFLGENKIIREDKKQWLSFIGFLNCDIEDNLNFYLNGFSERSLSKEYFSLGNNKVHIIKLSDDKYHISIE